MNRNHLDSEDALYAQGQTERHSGDQCLSFSHMMHTNINKLTAGTVYSLVPSVIQVIWLCYLNCKNPVWAFKHLNLGLVLHY